MPLIEMKLSLTDGFARTRNYSFLFVLNVPPRVGRKWRADHRWLKIQGLRDQREPLPLAVPEHHIRVVTDRSALHQARTAGEKDPPLRPRVQQGRRRHATVSLPRDCPVPLPRREPTDEHHLETRPTDAAGLLPEGKQDGGRITAAETYIAAGIGS